MTGDFDMAHISEMILGINIVVSQKTFRGEVVDEATVLEVFLDRLRLVSVVCVARIFLVLLGESSPLGLERIIRYLLRAMVVMDRNS